MRAGIADAGGRAHLVGISGGATVALLTCLEDPGHVASLLVSAGVAHAPRLVSLQRAIQRAMPEPVLARLLRSWYSGGQREYEQVATEDFRRCGKRTFLAALRELAHVDVRARLGEVAAPTLVACGSRDRANLGPSREIAAAVPGAELRFIPDAVHPWNCNSPSCSTRPLPSTSLGPPNRCAARRQIGDPAPNVGREPFMSPRGRPHHVCWCGMSASAKS